MTAAWSFALGSFSRGAGFRASGNPPFLPLLQIRQRPLLKLLPLSGAELLGKSRSLVGGVTASGKVQVGDEADQGDRFLDRRFTSLDGLDRFGGLVTNTLGFRDVSMRNLHHGGGIATGITSRVTNWSAF